MKLRIILAAIVLSVVSIGCISASAANREVIRLNTGWKFALGEKGDQYLPDFNDRDWQTVNVPHDAGICGPFVKENSTAANGWRPFQQGWYRKSFSVPDSSGGRKVFVEFEGVYRDAEVWINGHYLGRNLNGYIGFEYDLTEFVKWGGMNTLAVHYNNTAKGTSRWYTGEGIYRNVWLKFLPKVYIPLSGTYVTTPKINTDEALVDIQTRVVNETGKPGKLSIESRILDQSGKVVASAKAAALVEFTKEYSFSQEVPVPAPKLWDTGNPYLYRIESVISFNGVQMDVYSTKFGIREIRLSPEQGLLLNGKKVFAQGGDVHHDLGCLGAAALESGYRYRLQNLKEMGCNSIRLSHNPQAPVLLDLCDEMGILVIDEAFDTWTSQYYGGEVSFAEAWQKDLGAFIRRDRNHPSVYLWSVGNEVDKQHGSWDKKFESKGDGADYGVSRLRQLVDFTRSVDPTRKVTAALFPLREKGIVEWNKWDSYDEFMQSAPPPMAFNMDVVSWNYTENLFGTDHKNYPQMMFLASETGTNLLFGNRKLSMLEFDRSHVIGHYYWTAVTYLGESPWPSKGWNRAFFGLDERITPIGWIYKAFYTDKPMVKLLVKEPDPEKMKDWDKQYSNKRWSWYPMSDHWNWTGNEELEVQVVSNCDEIELLLNNKSLGSEKLDKDQGPVQYQKVAYEKGILIAVGKRNGKEVARDTIATSAKADHLVLRPNRAQLNADASDLAYIQVEIRDKNGRIVPDADRMIQFKITGPGTIAAVANSDINSDELFQDTKRSTVEGKCLVVIRSGCQKGNIVVTAAAKGLPVAEVVLLVK